MEMFIVFFGEDDFDFIKNNDKSITWRVTTPEFVAMLKSLKNLDIGYNEIYKETMQRCFFR